MYSVTVLKVFSIAMISDTIIQNWINCFYIFLLSSSQII